MARSYSYQLDFASKLLIAFGTLVRERTTLVVDRGSFVIVEIDAHGTSFLGTIL